MLSDHLCECGCGQFTNVNQSYDSRRGLFPGRPNRFILGHGARGRKPAPEQLQRQREGLQGHPVSPETRAKIAAAHRASGHRPAPEAAFKPGHKMGKREANPSWKGGRTTLNGYPAVYEPDHPRAYKTGYVYEHIVVAEQMLGRRLERSEVIHHQDGDKTNNTPENLRIFASQSDHATHHHAVKRSLSKHKK